MSAALQGWGIAWAEWRRTRRFFLLAVAVEIAFIVAAGLVPRLSVWAINYCLMACWLIGLHMLTAGNPRSNRNIETIGRTRCVFLLPASTWRIVSWILAYRLSAFSVALGMMTAAYVLYGPSTVPVFTVFAIGIGLFVLMQTVFFVATMGGLRSIYTWASIGLSYGTGHLFFQYNLHESDKAADLLALLLASGAVGFVLMVVSAYTVRSAGFRPGEFTRLNILAARSTGRRTRRFSTESQGLNWFIWWHTTNRAAKVMCGILLLSIVLITYVNFQESAQYRAAIPTDQWETAILLIIMAAGMTGTLTSQGIMRGVLTKQDIYLKLRPVDDAAIARSRHGVAVRAILLWAVTLALGIVASSAILQWLAYGEVHDLLPSYPLWVYLFVLLAPAWIAYWLSARILLATFVVAVTGIVSELLSFDLFPRDPNPTVMLAALCLAAATLIAPMGMAMSRQLISPQRAAVIGVCCVLITCLGYMALQSSKLLPWYSNAEIALICIATAVLMAGPFFAGPLAIYRSRHV